MGRLRSTKLQFSYIFVSFRNNVDTVVHYDNNPFWISADTNKDDTEWPCLLRVLRIVHPCHMAPMCPLLHFPHPRFWPCRFVHSRKFHQPDFGTNRKRIYEFLLVINSNFGYILIYLAPFLRCGDLIYWLKIAYFSYPSLIRHPRSLYMFHLEFRRKFTLSVMGLLCGEGCMTLTSTVFDWSTRVTDSI